MCAHSVCPLKTENLSWHPQWIPICPDLPGIQAPLPFPRSEWWTGVESGCGSSWVWTVRGCVPAPSGRRCGFPLPTPTTPAPGKDVGGCGLRGFGDRGPYKSSSAKRGVQAFFKSNLIKRSWTTKTYSKLMNWDSQCKREYSFSPSLCR